jgi:competence protein ComEC
MRIDRALVLSVAAAVASATPLWAQVRAVAGRLVITEIMADPAAVADERGEWFEVYNLGQRPIDLRGYRLASGNDVHVISRSVVVPPDGFVVLARDARPSANGGVPARYAYGAAITLANDGDWVALRDPSGTTIDSVAWRASAPGASWELLDPGADHSAVGGQVWRRATSVYGAGDRGTPGRPTERFAAHRPSPPVARTPAAAEESASGAMADAASDPSATELIVRVLDVGQGDAIYITNGGSKLIVDGGPDPTRFGQLLDSLGLNNSTIDVVVLSHEHYDHHSGLRELFRSSRRIRVRFFFENQDPSSSPALSELRDSIAARVERRELIYRDTDDPCADGRPICTITMRGGARLHVMRPSPRARDANNRSAPLKLVGPDSASFTMWLAGDAEHEAIRWFDEVQDYDLQPGMRVNVLKADHHGSCNGVTSRYLSLTNPDWVVVSLAAVNDYGHMHAQAKAAYTRAGKPWYRTDQNGTITIRSRGRRGSGYTIAVSRGRASASGPSDRASTQEACNPVP